MLVGRGFAGAVFFARGGSSDVVVFIDLARPGGLLFVFSQQPKRRDERCHERDEKEDPVDQNPKCDRKRSPQGDSVCLSVFEGFVCFHDSLGSGP